MTHAVVSLFRNGNRSAVCLYPFLAIVTCVFLGNYASIFSVDILINDDQYRHIFALENEVPWYIGRRSPALPPILYLTMELITISIELARSAVVLFVMIPTSLILYRIYSRDLGLTTAPATVAAILPNILPGQQLLPSFIDGSYTLYGLLAAIAGLDFALGYLRQIRRFHWKLVVSLCLFVLAAGIIDQIVFLSAPIILCVLWIRGASLRSCFITIPLLLLALVKLNYVLSNPWETAKPIELTFDLLNVRIQHAFTWTVPFSVSGVRQWVESLWVWILVLLGVTTVGIHGAWRAPLRCVPLISRFGNPSDRFKQYCFLLLLSAVWIVANAAPFLVSPHYQSRYLHIAAVGTCLFTTLIGFSVFRRIAGNSKLWTVTFAFTLILASAIPRHQSITNAYLSANRHQSMIRQKLSQYNFPINSQIVVLGPSSIPTGGHWNWSRGFFKYILNRPDIDGIHPYEYNFYDPFEPWKNWTQKMNGLVLERPTLIFRLDSPGQPGLEQIEYGLRWLNSEDINSHWSLYHFDPRDGSIEELATGAGMNEYEGLFNNRLNAYPSRSEVMWGGFPTDLEIARLNSSSSNAAL